MCGIAFGVNKNLTEAAVKKYLALRGPDDLSYRGLNHLSDNLDFYQSRLSIVDRVERSNQPMSFQDDNYMLIYNGEMYNFKEVRERLIALGRDFFTESDTEVFGASLIQWGVLKALQEVIIGPYAFIFYDKFSGKLSFGVDRHGEKPLYYCKKNNKISIASDQRIIVDSNTGLSITEDAIDVFSSLGYLPGKYELFPGIIRCQPGKVYQLSFHERLLSLTNLVYLKRKNISFSEALNRSVASMMDTDFTPAVLLSAGVDSRLLALKIKALKINATYWTLGFEGYKCEADLVEKWCENNKIHVRRIDISKSEFLKSMKEIQFNFDVPFGDTSAALMHYLAKEISKETRVVITGDGADEVFAAYPRYGRQFIGLLLGKVGLTELGWGIRPCRSISNMLIGFWRPSSVDLKNYLPFNGLVKSDRVFMTNKIENRAPYLHPEVTAHRTSILKSFIGKYKANQVRELNFMGSDLLISKSGFSVPYKEELSSLFSSEKISIEANIVNFRKSIFKFWCEKNGYKF